MATSRFMRRIDRAKREGAAKLKIIAPKYTPPKTTPKPSTATGGSGRSSGPVTGGGRSRPAPAPAPTPPVEPLPQSKVDITPKEVPADFIGPIRPTTKRRLPEPAPLEVQPAPTLGERFAKQREEKGLVKGSLSFVGGEVSALQFRSQEKAVREYGGSFDVQMAELSGKRVKGRPIQLYNQFIEKKKYRIDTRGEKAGLSIAKMMRQKKKGRRSQWLV